MRRALWVFAAATVLLFPTMGLADSISPVSVDATLGVGSSATITKTVTVDAGTPTTALVDVFFLADTTGSMYPVISSVQASASAILSGTSGLGSVAWGVGEYKDAGDTYVYRLDQAVTTSTSAVTAGIGMLGASGGGDYPEAQLYGLQTVATSSATGWREGSTKILVWFGDAPGHDPSYMGATEVSATAALTGAGIKVEAVNVGTGDLYAPFGAPNVGLNDTGQAQRIADATGGTFYTGVDSSSIVSTIIAAITESFDNYSSVGLDLSEAPVGVGVTAVPGSYVGAFDREISRTFNFSVTFTGLVPGTYDFNIYGTVDGGRVATEADHIVVGSTVPEPGTLLLLGSGLVGLIGYRRRTRMM